MGNSNAITGISEENLNWLTTQVYVNLYQSSKLFKDTKVFDKPHYLLHVVPCSNCS